MIRLVALQEEGYCVRTQAHSRVCTGRNHICYRCGMLTGPCRHVKLGTLLDY